MNRFRILVYTGIILIAASVIVRVNAEMYAFSNVILGVGGLLLIAGMAYKRKMDEK